MAHRKQRVKCPLNGKTYNIDIEIMLLVAEIWNQGIYTTESCQGGQGSACIPEGCSEPAYVSFNSITDAEWLWNLIKRKRWGLILTQDTTRTGWTVHFNPDKISAVYKIIKKEIK